MAGTARARTLSRVPDLIITRSGPGVTQISSADPFSSLVVHRISRDQWKETPAEPGVYVLWGVVQEKAAMYIGMSTTDMRSRIRQHHVSARKNWFGTLFAVPLASALCPAVEAELLQRVGEANVIGLIDNRATEARWLNADVVHVDPAVQAIVEALEMLIGTDAFTGHQEDDGSTDETVDRVERVPQLARVYRGRAASPRARQASDPADATHANVVARTPAWGRFEGPDPELPFRVLKGSSWRPGKTPDPSNVTHDLQVRVRAEQQDLIDQGVLDEATHTFTHDHVFPNWTYAARIVGGVGQYSGAYHWQLLEG
jgi:hypothetical protein